MPFFLDSKFKPAKKQNKLTSYVVRKFNNKGLLTQQNYILKNKFYIYSYDNKYRLTKIEFNDGFKIFNYKNNRVVNWKYILKDSTVRVHSISKYMTDGKLIESKINFNTDFNKSEIIKKYAYNDYNDLIGVITTKKGLSEKEKKCAYDYDRNHNMIHSKCIDKMEFDVYISDDLFFYKDTTLYKKIHMDFRNGIPVGKYIYEYDNLRRDSIVTSYSIEKNKPIKTEKKETIYNANGAIIHIKNQHYHKSKWINTTHEEYKYIYDNYGNWVIKCYIRNEPKNVKIRYFTYTDKTNSKFITKEEALLFCNPNYKESLIEFNKKKLNIEEKEVDENNGSDIKVGEKL